MEIGIGLGINRFNGAGGGGAPPATPPVNTVAPALSGDFFVGRTLTSSTGAWTGTPTITYTYQWQNAGVNIGGATNNTYVLQATDDGDSIRCVVTATNSAGSASANSNAVIGIQAVLWLDASDSGTITQVANAISQWNDKSGQGNNAVQATGASQPIYQATGLDGTRPCVTAPAGQHFIIPDISLTTFTIFQIQKPIDNGSNKITLQGVTGSLQLRLDSLENQNIVRMAQALIQQAVVAVSTIDPSNILTRTTGGATGTAIEYNGVSAGTSATAPAISQPISMIFSTTGANNVLAFSELIVCAYELTTAQLNQVGNYQAAKWGLTWTNI